jgi:hypothetical protein
VWQALHPKKIHPQNPRENDHFADAGKMLPLPVLGKTKTLVATALPSGGRAGFSALRP